MATPIHTPEHDALRASIRAYVDRELVPFVDEWEEAGFFPDSVFRRCGELGFLGLHYPERWGGSGGDLAAGLLLMEELGRCGAGGISMAVGVQTHMATPALAEFGTDEQREAYLRPAIRGHRIAAIAITERALIMTVSPVVSMVRPFRPGVLCRFPMRLVYPALVSERLHRPAIQVS